MGLKDLFDGGFLDIYSGGQPAGADYAETGVKLVRLTTTSGTGVTDGLRFGTAASGQIFKGTAGSQAWSGIVSVAGVAGYFRLYGTAGTSGSSPTEVRIDGNVGVSGSDLVMANTSLTANATFTIDTFTLIEPAS
jgi:hypothetical protein